MLTSVLVLLAGGACALVPHSPCVQSRREVLVRTASSACDAVLLTRSAAAATAASAATAATAATAGSSSPPTAIAALRFSVQPRISPLPPVGALSRYEDELVGPKTSGQRSLSSVPLRFEYPSQLVPLDRATGGIQFVDGSTGLKLYILRAPLPPDADGEQTSLANVPKQFFGKAIFSPEGSIVRGGTNIDEFKVTSSRVTDAPFGASGVSRRRLALKYVAVSGGRPQGIDRRGLVDAYEVAGEVYMLVVSATATKWDASEKARCEAIADSFFIGRVG